ncbi:hypothetical protein D9C73_013391 [Collichthys lucidus]|uniref:Uncharacterized protein n=1 Tax=Collichthys lucidus TaxID=240159 RepID=A0A4U5UYF0_COLLU|nr:hypothetical protein D9C73_013391 [Collichthys lucidus]
MRWNNRMIGGMEAEEEMEKRRVRMVAEEERRRLGNQQGILTRDIPNKFLSHGNTNSFSHPRKEAFSDQIRSETLASYRENGESYRTDIEGKNRGQESLHCSSCHSTYRPPEQNMRQGRNHTNMRDSPLFEGIPSQYRQIDRGGNVNHDQFDMMKNTELKRETRNVTFDLERSRTLEGNSHSNDKREDDERTSRDKERLRRHKAKVQSSRLLKVKLNLNPLRKSKVHPKRKAEQGHSEKKSPKKSRDKRQDGKDRGEKERKGKSGKKGSKTKGSTEDGGKEDGEEGEKNKGTSKKGQESTEGDQGENKLPENTTTHTADPLASAFAIGQGQNFLGGHFQYQGAGLAMGSAQHPFSLSATGRNQTSNLSLLGSAGSQLTGSSLSLPGGNFMLNTMAPGSNARFPSYPANSVAPNMAISGPSMAPSGVPDSFMKQGGTQLPPDSSIAKLKSDPAQGLGLQTGKGVQQLPPESPQTKESHTLPTQAPPSADGSTTLQASSIVEKLSNSTSQTEAGRVPAGPTVNTSTAVLTEGLAAGVSGDSMQAADGSVLGVSAPSMSTQSVSSMDDAGPTAALLQQEYLSEEGGSSPRRKLRLVLPEKTSNRLPTALERKIR